MKRMGFACLACFSASSILAAGNLAHAANPASQFSTAYQINPAHSGAITFSTPFAPPLKLAWKQTFPGAVSYPIVAEGMVFVSVANSVSGSPLLVALNLATGKIVWEKEVAIGALAYDDGRLFFTDMDGPLQAYAAKLGVPLWSTQLPGQLEFNFLPVAQFGSVYAGGDESGTTLYQVDEATGKVGWTQLLAAGGQGATLGDGQAYFSIPCDLPAFALSTGKTDWNYYSGCDGGGGTVAAYYDGLVFAPGVNLFSGVVLNAKTGAVVGSLNGNLPAFYGYASFTASSSGIAAVNIKTGNLFWQFGTTQKLVGSPIVINSTVFVATATGDILAVNAKTGKLMQTLSPGLGGGAGSSYQTVSGLGAGQGYLVAPTGNVLSAYKP